MSKVEPWMFTKDETAERLRRAARLEELTRQGITRDALNCRTETAPGLIDYIGVVPEGVELTNMDISIVCDIDNAWFGAMVTRRERNFRCTVFTGWATLPPILPQDGGKVLV